MRWSPDSLAGAAEGRLIRSAGRPVAGAFIDSRDPVVGGLFVPIVAARDGHDFLGPAIEAGAAAVLIGRGRTPPDGNVTIVEVEDTLVGLTRLAAARRMAFGGPVVSVTGSNGKTTTRAMIFAVLASAHPSVLCTRGNLNNHLGVPLTLLGEPHDPDAMVLELGMSAPGENAHLADIVRPNIHVVTSVALEHLEFMKTIEAIAAAEAEPLAFVPHDGAIVVPSDEPLLRPHLPSGPTCLRFGPDDDAQVQIVSVEQGERTDCRLRLPGGEDVRVRLELFGVHNARNAAAALAVGLHLGLPVGPMIEALEGVHPVGDRGRVLRWGPHLVIADCYNANPGSMQTALRSLAELDAQRSGPRVAVVGDMLELGPHENELHAEVGEQAADLGLELATFGERMRHATEAARREGGVAHHFDDLDSLAQHLRARFDQAEPGAILLKGSRGMKLERVLDALMA